MEKEDSAQTNKLDSPTAEEKGNMPDVLKEDQKKGDSTEKNSMITPPDEVEENVPHVQKEDEEKKNVNGLVAEKEGDAPDFQKDGQENEDSVQIGRAHV